MLQEFWDEGYGAEGDDEAYNWDTDERQISDQEAGTAHDSMQVPTSATGHEEEAQAAATGHEEAEAAPQARRRSLQRPGDNEHALAEVPSSATGQRRKDIGFPCGRGSLQPLAFHAATCRVQEDCG